MRDLTRSLIRFSWATGLLGASRLAAAVAPSTRPNRRATCANGARPGGLDGATWAAQGELGELSQAVFQAGDDLQDEWLDLLTDAMAPWRWPRAASRLAARSLDTLRVARPDAAGTLARQELKNKLEVYRSVKDVRGRLGHPPAGVRFALEPYVARAFEHDAYRALWLIEGLGHDYAETALRHDAAPSGLLQPPAHSELPAASLPMLHGGLGLALAEHVLAVLSPASSTAEARRALERFVRLCRANSAERHLDSAIESLGLDARCFFPDLVGVLERGLRDLDDPALYRFFWHGAGRALYFVPVNFIPGYGSLRHALAMARREAPGETAWSSAVAGIAYAFAMVNMAQPAILEGALHDRELRGSAFADGVAAAIAMRQAITPAAPALRRLADHRPGSGTARQWREVVGDPCRRVLDGAGGAERPEIEVYRSLS